MTNTKPHAGHGGSSLHFEEGEVYFCAYFADNDMVFPFVGSYVHIGKNVLGSEKEATWYFQDCESFARYGSFLGGVKADRQILGLTRDSASNMVTLDELVPELRRAEERRLARDSRGTN